MSSNDLLAVLRASTYDNKKVVSCPRCFPKMFIRGSHLTAAVVLSLRRSVFNLTAWLLLLLLPLLPLLLQLLLQRLRLIRTCISATCPPNLCTIHPELSSPMVESEAKHTRWGWRFK